jgi:Predicted membrane protein (DUF2306)
MLSLAIHKSTINEVVPINCYEMHLDLKRSIAPLATHGRSYKGACHRFSTSSHLGFNILLFTNHDVTTNGIFFYKKQIPMHKLTIRRLLRQAVWVIVFLSLLFYGLVAFNSGLTLSPFFNKNTPTALDVKEIIRKAEVGIPQQGSELTQRTLPFWINALAKVSSEGYMYSRDSIMTAEEYYHRMPVSDKFVLSTHMMLGLVIMVLGSLQFWPSFRHKFRKAHRYTGIVYIFAALTSMGMAINHLIVTGPDDTYDTFVFNQGLWLLAIGSIATIGLACYSIYVRNTAAHLGWQAIAFGFFLTAPIQRADWFLLSPLSQYATFNEVNQIVNVVLLTQAILASYLLFFFNRKNSPLRSTELPSKHKPRSPSFLGQLGKKAITALLVLLFFTVIYHFALNPGFGQSSAARSIFPKSLIDLDQRLYQSTITNIAYAASVAIIICSQLLLMWRSNLHSSLIVRAMLVFASLIAAGITIFWGKEMGLPTYAHASGGAFYLLNGFLLLVFSALICGAWVNQKLTLASELSAFVVAIAIAPSLTYWIITAMALTAAVPMKYIPSGAGYELSVTTALFIGLLVAMIHAIYGGESRRFIIK